MPRILDISVWIYRETIIANVRISLFQAIISLWSIGDVEGKVFEQGRLSRHVTCIARTLASKEANAVTLRSVNVFPKLGPTQK